MPPPVRFMPLREGMDNDLERVFRFFDRNKTGTISKQIMVCLVEQLELPIDLQHFLEGIPDAHELDLHEFKSLVKKAFSPNDASSGGNSEGLGVSSTLQDVKRAKKLASESQGKESLHVQMTNLFHMQHHYRQILQAQASVDSWHYSPQSTCYHSLISLKNVHPSRRRTGRMLPMERMHLILTGEVKIQAETLADDRFDTPRKPTVTPRKTAQISNKVSVVSTSPRDSSTQKSSSPPPRKSGKAPVTVGATASTSSSSGGLNCNTNTMSTTLNRTMNTTMNTTVASGMSGAQSSTANSPKTNTTSEGSPTTARRRSLTQEQEIDFVSKQLMEVSGQSHHQEAPRRSSITGERRVSLGVGGRRSTIT